MSKRIHHMGTTLTKEEHDRSHKESPKLTPKQHDATKEGARELGARFGIKV